MPAPSETTANDMLDLKIGHFLISTDARDSSRVLGLSRRERETLRHLSKGLNVAGVAKLMDVSVNTINTYKTRVFEKLGVHTTAEAMVLMTAAQCGALVRKPEAI